MGPTTVKKRQKKSSVFTEHGCSCSYDRFRHVKKHTYTYVHKYCKFCTSSRVCQFGFQFLFCGSACKNTNIVGLILSQFFSLSIFWPSSLLQGYEDRELHELPHNKIVISKLIDSPQRFFSYPYFKGFCNVIMASKESTF